MGRGRQKRETEERERERERETDGLNERSGIGDDGWAMYLYTATRMPVAGGSVMRSDDNKQQAASSLCHQWAEAARPQPESSSLRAAASSGQQHTTGRTRR